MEVLASPAERRTHLLHWILPLLLVCPSAVSARAVDEYGLKAVFLYNFFKFVEWPGADVSGALTLCIVGDDPFGLTIDEVVKDKVVNGRKIEVRRLKAPAEAKRCQIVFIRSGQRSKALQLLEAVKGLPVLTVGEDRDFEEMGGLVYLTLADNQVNINISVPGTASVGLKVSAKLLSLANRSKSP